MHPLFVVYLALVIPAYIIAIAIAIAQARPLLTETGVVSHVRS